MLFFKCLKGQVQNKKPNDKDLIYFFFVLVNSFEKLFFFILCFIKILINVLPSSIL